MSYQVKTDELRNSANLLANLCGIVQESRERVMNAHLCDNPFGGEGDIFSGIQEHWGETLFYLVRVLDDNVENIHLDSQALRAIADRYDEDDESAARAMGRAVQ